MPTPMTQPTLSRSAVEELEELRLLVDALALPSEKARQIREVCDRIDSRFTRMGKMISFFKSALGELRSEINYLFFDLRSTKNERDCYLSLLNDANRSA